MNILALDSSAKACSVAIFQDTQCLAHTFLHNGFTHSKTLLPAVAHVLEQCDFSLSQMDIIAVAVGPGSFTGLRIGVSTAKGLAFAHNIPCAPCSTLASMAWQLAHMEGYTVICTMDARKKQVYHGLFFIDGGVPQRLCPDKALSLDELAEQLSTITTPMVLVGDGATLTYEALSPSLSLSFAPTPLRHQTALGVAQEGYFLATQNALVSSNDLLPQYHRLSQAERERLEKSQKMS